MAKVKKAIAILALFLLLFSLIGMIPVFAKEEGEEMENLAVELDFSYGRCRCEWEEPAGMEGQFTYNVTLQAVSESGEAGSLISETTYYPSFQADDYIAYACQENGFPYRMRILVEGSADGEKTAEGVSEAFDPRDVFPEKKELVFGTDIPLERICGITWDSFSDEAEGNWSRSVRKFEDEVTFYSSGVGKKDIERKLKDSDWDQLLSILSKGYMERSYVMDPTIQVLDGSGSGIKVDWEDEKENVPSYYSFVEDEKVRGELQDWLLKKEKGSFSWILPAAIVILCCLVLAVILLLKRK